MKRIIGMLLALCCLISLSAGTAMATIKIGDKITVKGQMRFRYWDKANYDFNGADDHQHSYWDQRYRLWFDVQASEGISAHLRFDFDDARWGDESYGSSRWNVDEEGHDDTIEVNRAYLVLAQPQSQFKIVGGLNYWELGNRLTYENSGTGVTIESTQLPVIFKFGYVLEDELGSRDDTEGDQSNYFIQLDTSKLVKNHQFKIFYADADDNDKKFDAWVAGISAKGKFLDNKLSYKAEFDVLGGEELGIEEDERQDIFGQQFWLETAYEVSKKFTFGGHFVYAKGADNEDEDQYDSIHDARADNWDIQTYGPFKTMYGPLGMADVLDPEGQNTGGIGGALYCKYKIFDKLETYFQYLYVEAESNDLESQTFENAAIATVAARYYFTKKTQFALMYGHATMDVEDSTVHDDPEQTIGAMLRVSF